VKNATRCGAILFFLAVPVTASPAYACMAPGPDGFTSGVIWKTAPDDVPKRAMVLEINSIKSIPQTWAGFVAKVQSGPRGMVGKTYRFSLEIANSCASLGRGKGYIVVRRTPVPLGFGVDGKPQAFLSAISYSESWLNWIVRLFSDDPWQFPGEQVLRDGQAFGHKSERDF
jgi:hypothetical protein